MNKIPVSAVVVTYNEEKYLEKCLKSVNFCEEVVVIDLGSKDKSIEIAKKYATKVIHHERVPVVEVIHAKIRKFVKYDWVLITDPDEITDKVLAKELISLFEIKLSKSTEIGSIVVPWQFYFKARLLKGTIWGGINKRVYLVNINRFVFTESVHAGRKLIDGFKEKNIKHNGKNVVHHYWMSSYTQLIKKHKRYIKQEGKNRYETGQRIKFKSILRTPYKAFKHCFYIRKGYKDGLLGLFLSFFGAWYSVSAEISLYRYQRKND